MHGAYSVTMDVAPEVPVGSISKVAEAELSIAC